MRLQKPLYLIRSSVTLLLLSNSKLRTFLQLVLQLVRLFLLLGKVLIMLYLCRISTICENSYSLKI
jgi:hypothetical protein